MAQGMQARLSQPAAPAEASQSVSTEFEHLRVRVIALENLLISMLARAPHEELGLCIEMAAFISPTPGFTHHPRTLGAATQMLHLLDRARHFQGWVEGDALF